MTEMTKTTKPQKKDNTEEYEYFNNEYTFISTQRCDECGGSGEDWRGRFCSKCYGDGIIEKEEDMTMAQWDIR